MAIVRHIARKEAESELFDGEGAPLASLSAKTKLACALGIIDEDQRKHIDSIRHIRNAVAHALWQVTFQTPEVAQEVDTIKGDDLIWTEDKGYDRRQRYGAICFAIWLKLFLYAIDFPKIAEAINEWLNAFTSAAKSIASFAERLPLAPTQERVGQGDVTAD
jgi:hypothetical protein